MTTNQQTPEAKYSKPFCFRCGEPPVFQLELNHRKDEYSPKVEGPIWPMCADCFINQIPWGEILANSARGILERYEDE